MYVYIVVSKHCVNVHLSTCKGLFHLRKIPCLNSLIGHFPETMDLAFKLKRKKFLIEVSLL